MKSHRIPGMFALVVACGSLLPTAQAGEMSREMFGPTGSPVGGVQVAVAPNCCEPAPVWQPSTSFYAPSYSASYAPSYEVQPTTSYYAPTVAIQPTTACYAPSACSSCGVTTAYYAPTVPIQSSCCNSTTVLRPVSAYYAPTVTYRPVTVTSFYAPVTTFYSPAVVQPVIVRPAFVPGQPVRNFFRARWW